VSANDNATVARPERLGELLSFYHRQAAQLIATLALAFARRPESGSL
jgi:hypothetical protein